MDRATRTVAVHPTALKPGEMVGQYEIVERIGEGGMGCVYKVRRGEAIYVLKLLSSCFLDEASGSEEQREYQLRAVREFFALNAVDHRNVVRAYGTGRWPEETRGWPYIVTEFVDGADILSWRDEAQPSLRRIVTVLGKAADALGHIHRAGLFHRDVKAPNILVRGESDEPVLIDLGLARHVAMEPVTVHVKVVGTVRNFPPEYVEYLDSPAYANREPFTWTSKVDLYGFGYVAYELLTGRSPVVCSGGESELLSAIKGGAVPVAREVNGAVPEALSRVVMRLLEKDPAARHESAFEVRDALREVWAALDEMADEPFPVPPGPVPLPRVPTGVATLVPEVMPIPSFLPTELRAKMAGEAQARAAAGADAEAAIAEPGCGEGATQEEGAAEPAEEAPDLFAGKNAGPPEASQGKEPPAAGARPAEPPDPAKAPANPPAAGDKPPAKKTGIASIIRKAEERLVQGAPRPRFSPRVMLVAGGAAACGLLVALTMCGKPAEKNDMLARLERQQASGVQGGAHGASSPAGSLPLDLMAAPPGPLRLSTPDAPPPSASDAKDIDAALAARYGRPTVPPGGVSPAVLQVSAAPGGVATSAAGGGGAAAPARRAPADDDPLLHAEVLDAASSVGGGGPRKLGIAMGTHIRAKLLTNLDSRTIGTGPVEAVLPLPFVVKGSVVLPARTMLYGRANESSGRFAVQFTRLRMPDDTEIEFDGLALDRNDNKPGLAASARIVPQGYEEDGLGTKIARGSGNVILNTVTGGVPQDLARGAGSTIVNNRGSGGAGGAGGAAILLDAGAVFDVFVSATF